MKRDRASTEWRQSEDAGPLRFLDKRSYMGGNGHEYLFGADRSNRRKELFILVKGRCFECGSYAPETGAPGFHGEVNHPGCYCLACIKWTCGQLVAGCHRHRTLAYVRKHGRLAKARAEAEREFKAKYPEHFKEKT